MTGDTKYKLDLSSKVLATGLGAGAVLATVFIALAVSVLRALGAH